MAPDRSLSLLVVLNNLRRPHMRLIWITSDLPQRLALPQQVPALIQLDINFRQPRTIGISARLVFEQAMLLCREALDNFEDGLIICFVFHNDLLRACLKSPIASNAPDVFLMGRLCYLCVL